MASERALRVIAQAVDALVRDERAAVPRARNAMDEFMCGRQTLEHAIVYFILNNLACALDGRLDDEPSVDEDG